MKRSLTSVHDVSSPEFAACMEILRESIPAREQLPIGRVEQLLSGESYRLFSFGTGGDTQAIAMVYFSTKLPFALLDYMAVRSDIRGKGVGASLFREVLTTVQRTSAEWLLIEVDDDRQGTVDQQGLNRRRIKFYRRLGARVVTNVPYLFPSPSGPPVPMLLMVHPLDSDGNLSPNDLGLAVSDVFLHVHTLAADSQLLRWFKNNLPRSLDMK